MTRITANPIDSPFVRLDDRTTAPDQFANIHDMHQTRKNIALALARRVRAPIITKSFHIAGNLLRVRGFGPISENGEGGMLVFQTPFEAPWYCPSIKVAVRGAAAGSDVLLFCEVTGQQSTSVPYLDRAITFTAGAGAADQSISVELPPHASDSRLMILSVYVSSKYYGADLKAVASAVVSASGDDWVEVSNNSGGVGDMIYCQTNTMITPRLVIDTYQKTAVTWQYVTNLPWSFRPTYTDTINWRAVGYIDIYSIVVYPDATVSFDAYGAIP